MDKLRNLDVADIPIAVPGGLKGLLDAITAAFAETTIQTCFVHLILHAQNVCP